MVPRTGARVKKLAIAVLLVLVACRGPLGRGGPNAGGAGTPKEAIERFLSAAKAQDYDAMGLIFGSADGPARATIPKADLEKRQFIMMRCLRHDRYTVGTETPTPTGERMAPVQFVYRDLTLTSNFAVVQGPNGRWYVKQFDPDALQSICTSL